jgi:hypothetical protein
MTHRKLFERLHGPWSAVSRAHSHSAHKILTQHGNRYAEVMGSEGRNIEIVAEAVAAAPEAFQLLDQIRLEWGLTGRLSGETVVHMDSLLDRFDPIIERMDRYSK